MFHEDFDCHRLGRFVLGRFSRILSPSERKEFLRLFEYYVVATYSDRLSEYVGGGVAGGEFTLERTLPVSLSVFFQACGTSRSMRAHVSGPANPDRVADHKSEFAGE